MRKRSNPDFVNPKTVKFNKNPQQELIIVLDRSGSMADCWDDTLGGLNTYLDTIEETSEKENIDTYVTINAFDDQFMTLVPRTNVSAIPRVTGTMVQPRGWTALYDAIGKTLVEMHPGLNTKVLFVVITDGGENSSQEFNQQRIVSMIREREMHPNWTIVTLGANIDAWTAGSSYGSVNVRNTMSYNKADTRTMFAGLCNSTISYMASDNAKSVAFFDGDDTKLATSVSK